jgi:hypothetical protein
MTLSLASQSHSPTYSSPSPLPLIFVCSGHILHILPPLDGDDLTSYSNVLLRSHPFPRPVSLPIYVHPPYLLSLTQSTPPHLTCLIFYVAAVYVIIFAWFANPCILGTRFPSLISTVLCGGACALMCRIFVRDQLCI